MAGLVLAAVGWSVLAHVRSPDPRRYPDDSGPTVTYGDGSLEAVLPHYGLELPCDVRDVRYLDSESFVGSGGTLYIKFATSLDCLAEFRVRYGLSDERAARPTDGFNPFFVDGAGPCCGWTFEPARTYAVWKTRVSDRVWLYVLVEAAPAEATVYLEAVH
jgi:hypothetical protein